MKYKDADIATMQKWLSVCEFVENQHDIACAKHNKLARRQRAKHHANSPHAVKNRSK